MGRGGMVGMAVLIIVVIVKIMIVRSAMQGGAMRMAIFIFMTVTWQAVNILAVGIRRSEKATTAHPGHSDTSTGTFCIGVGDPPFRPMRYPVVIGSSPSALDTQGDRAFACRNPYCAGTFARSRLGRHLD